ncbi:hypothetical protein M422DRAFT_783076 [Sphaerobolus stellatus SS14]|uniref:Uncharacterized protein n=1 Tax=Sphaerobolus stellatus (strain SS14) TaxID=990650 RepID=A0A0C9V8I3_SPHS4|nr:hypothetical protein M422DRAFT_783076 [Sphaerobolus stellatus SS14]
MASGGLQELGSMPGTKAAQPGRKQCLALPHPRSPGIRPPPQPRFALLAQSSPASQHCPTVSVTPLRSPHCATTVYKSCRSPSQRPGATHSAPIPPQHDTGRPQSLPPLPHRVFFAPLVRCPALPPSARPAARDLSVLNGAGRLQNLSVLLSRVLSAPSVRCAAPSPLAISMPRRHATPLRADSTPEQRWEASESPTIALPSPLHPLRSQHCTAALCVSRHSPSQRPVSAPPLSAPIPPQGDAGRLQNLPSLLPRVLSTLFVRCAAPPLAISTPGPVPDNCA